MKLLGNMRKAYAWKGDDVTLTRWIKMPGRHAKASFTAPMPADAVGTRFKSRVLRVAQMGSLLVSGHSNIKVGRDVRKGRHQGYWIYTLSLEERASCPTTCEHWRDCYGNAMPFAKRIDHTDPAFLPALEAEIARLVGIRGRKGILIRLHALGDFYALDYIAFWRRMLAEHANLAIYGYTAHDPDGDMGWALRVVSALYPERFMMRFSGADRPFMATVAIKREEDCPPNAFVCPEQTGKTLACATCGACWSGVKNVAFLDH